MRRSPMVDWGVRGVIVAVMAGLFGLLLIAVPKWSDSRLAYASLYVVGALLAAAAWALPEWVLARLRVRRDSDQRDGGAARNYHLPAPAETCTLEAVLTGGGCAPLDRRRADELLRLLAADRNRHETYCFSTSSREGVGEGSPPRRPGP